MHRIRVWIRGFFGFSRKETNAFLVLLPLMVVILVSEPVYHAWQLNHEANQIFDRHYADSLLATLTFTKTDCTVTKLSNKRSFRFHEFDPNSITEKELVDMGLKPFIASRIVRYREKGGKIKRKTDLLRMYGMDSAWFKEADPWIRLSEPVASEPVIKTQPVKEIQLKEAIDMNTADSVQLVSVFGIGPTLSKRIRGYREKLGGFVSMDQLSEVYGLDTIALKRLKIDFFIAPSFVPRQIDLNADNIEALTHPYVKRREAQAIIAYRKQHGNFDSVEELLQIPLLNSVWLEKLRPYLFTH